MKKFVIDMDSFFFKEYDKDLNYFGIPNFEINIFSIEYNSYIKGWAGLFLGLPNVKKNFEFD